MKRPTSVERLRTLSHLSDRLVPFVLLGLLIPTLLLAAFGLFVAIRDGYLWHVLGLSAILGLLAVVPVLYRRLRQRRTASATAAPIPELDALLARDVPANWTAADRLAYTRALPELRAILASDPGWKTLPDHALALTRHVATLYRKGRTNAHWSITPIEALALLETLSRRYRHLLKQHVPGIDHMRISQLMWVDTQIDRFGPLMRLYAAYRKIRILTPEGALAELRSQLLDSAFGGMAEELQTKLQALLLLDALHLAIDLYGGHFRYDDDALEESRVVRDDTRHAAAQPEPVRVCLVGQTGAGKSSIVNALLGSLRAEVSALPSTDQKQVYDLTRDSQTLLRLIDLPGLNGSNDTQALLKEITQSDIILWVLRANQPARRLDTDFLAKVRAWYAHDKQRQREMPIILGVLSQADRLARQSAGQSSPHAPADIVREAIAYNQELLELPHILPLSTKPDCPDYPVSALLKRLEDDYDRALNVQLNRRRLEAGEFSAGREWQRIRQAGRSLFSTYRQDL